MATAALATAGANITAAIDMSSSSGIIQFL